MACHKIRRWISDNLDGRLGRRRQAKIAGHISRCASCRDYRSRLERIQNGARALSSPQVSSEYWESAISRLKLRIGTPEARNRNPVPGRVPIFGAARRWAWAGAVSILALSAGLYLILSTSRLPVETYPLTLEETINRLYERIGDNPALEDDFALLLQASIKDQAGDEDGDVKRLLYGNSSFIESLSDEEVQLLDSHLNKELKL
jgi:hypothetical protein